MSVNLWWFTGTLLVCIICKYWFIKKESLPTPAGAIIMAHGIFFYSAMREFPTLYDNGELLALILAGVWLAMVVSIFSALCKGEFHKKYLQHPIQLFAVGTWVAGTSVLGNVIHEFSINLGFIPYLMGTFNVILYIWYVCHCIDGFKRILQGPEKNNVHGVLLLATVGTQSIVILLFNIFNNPLPDYGNALILSFGLLLYVTGFLLIMRRYLWIRNWKIADDWKNTNCIIHGAISISGLAASLTTAFPVRFIFVLWIWAVSWFVVVEAIELWRVVARIKCYGVAKGIARYDISQWSRNFTFGMLYAFTVSFSAIEGEFVIFVRELILSFGPWLVLAFLLYEIILFIKDKVESNIRQNGRTKEVDLRETKA
ncbi:TDT family transporter [Salibacterium aidingense]|uniref:hypothetical protein n=1 Tax=Salibacterium aidingense TaxID=384933 RepID=UPI0004246CCD|nr:hypothetical protein [Salibacterium aidingense]